MLELILTREPSEWTDEERKAASEEEGLSIDHAYTPVSHDYRAVQWERPCSIVEFCKRNPDVKVVSISCSCPACTVHCVTG